ncbi:MAG: histidine kinase [Bacteroidota bacterium]
MSSKANYKIIGIHILLWVAYGLLSFNWFSNFTTFDRALVFAIRSVVIHSIIFYINIKVLLPRFVDKNRYWLYILSVLVLIIAAHFLSEFTRDLMNQITEFTPSRPKRMGGRKWLVGPKFFIRSASTIAVLFISTTYWMTQQARKRRQKDTLLQNRNLSSELKFLKSQINPHFLFNALNNIYSLSYTQSNQTPDMIMKLSDMMRYVLYESNEKKVSLAKEISYMANFIDFQKLKIEGEPNITFETKDVDSSLMVEPMLFIPFIENSFKHSDVEDTDKGSVSIKLTSENNAIHFTVDNTISASESEKDKTPGIGLENVMKRLNLLYPDRHELKIDGDEQTFSISLVILI